MTVGPMVSIYFFFNTNDSSHVLINIVKDLSRRQGKKSTFKTNLLIKMSTALNSQSFNWKLTGPAVFLVQSDLKKEKKTFL